MPRTEKQYPEWVQNYRMRGTTVKKRGYIYYLYKRTSRRVPGKKYPQPVDTFIGVITPEGIITPSLDEFLKTGSRKQPHPVEGDALCNDIQRFGLIASIDMTAKEMMDYKRSH